MPVYEYLCENCEHQFQQHRKVTERQSAPCPRCNGVGRKVIGAVGIIFKGSGWHCTDYRKTEDKNADKPETEKVPAAVSKPDSADPAG